MKHLGDITKIKNADPVDCVTFGSPCQDLSIAGKRQGLNGERSGLFIEAVRIIKEMRGNSNGKYPTFAVWENVPGAFSSNKGEDFRVVLEELARIKEPEVSIPRPENGKWAKAGSICGDGWSIAWRTFDAQFWGVPQRRRRIAVVVDFGGQRAGQVLFERAGVSGHLEPSIQAWKGIARDPAHGASGHDRVVGCSYEPKQMNSVVGDDPINTLMSTMYKDPVTVCVPINTQIATRHISLGERTSMGFGADGDPAYTFQAVHEHAVCYLLNDQGGQSINVEDGRISPTLRAESHAHEPCICIATGQSNAEILEECCPTLNCNHEQPIVFENHSQDARYTQQGDTSPTCTAQLGTGGNNMPLVAETLDCRNHKSNGDLSGTLQAKENGGYSLNYINPVAVKTLRWIVRRLTPTECERLQGFPDGWTDIGEWTDIKGKRHKQANGPRYKALGNSIALPQWWWITCKMSAYLPEHATLGSLFDGIGGFPLVWETRHGKGTAVWASEIEEFPIAVTKERFK